MEGMERAMSSGRKSTRSRNPSWNFEEGLGGAMHSSRRSSRNEDEEALIWAAIEKLPTYNRLRTGIIQSIVDIEYPHKKTNKEVDVLNLDVAERQDFIDKIFKVAEEDNEKFLNKFRRRIDKVGITLPTVEVRYEHVTVEADCQVGSRALPTIPNVARNIVESVLGLIGIEMAQRKNLSILKDATGIIKPARMALLMGPPSSGKTTLLLALAGKLDPSLKVKGEISYNGHRLDEFVPLNTSAYISQNDVHVGEMTVKECLDFSARCQGVGTRYELLTELAKREKEAGIFPEAEVDLFMKKCPRDFNKLDNQMQQFKGISSSIGAKKVKVECQHFREFCKTGNGEGCMTTFQPLRKEHATLKKKLEAYFQMARQAGAIGSASRPK